MKMLSRLLLVLMICMMLAACGSTAAEETAAPTAAPTEAVETEPEQTEAPTEPPLAEPVMPEGDAATGTLQFYFNDKAIHAGSPMEELVAVGIRTSTDLEQMIQPGNMSDVIPAHVEVEDESDDDDPMVFVVAMNTADEAKPITECMIYSITVNTDSGIKFGSGNEAEAFVTGETTREQIIEAYGEPTFSQSNHGTYHEIAYYQPFNCAYFSFKSNEVRQIVTYYSANVYADLAESFEYDLGGEYFGSDALILMNQYMDVEPYLDGENEEVEDLEALNTSIVMGGQTIETDVACIDMPDPFGKPFKDLLMPVSRSYYVRTGIGNEEEFYLINLKGQTDNLANKLIVKGFITENRNYTNWGADNSGFHEFEYQGLTQDSTIEDILEIFGEPKEIQGSSSGRVCYVWMFYEDASGNTLRLRVDPMLNQLVELRLSKYYSGEHYYS